MGHFFQELKVEFQYDLHSQKHGQTLSTNLEGEGRGRGSSAVQKILSGQTFIDILSHHCDLGLENSNPICLQDVPACDSVL